jgi:hypothetical protein
LARGSFLSEQGRFPLPPLPAGREDGKRELWRRGFNGYAQHDRC